MPMIINQPPKNSGILVLVLGLVLIKNNLFIKRMLTQKAFVYPGFFLTKKK